MGPLPWPSGAAYLDGAYMPIGEAKIPVTDWGYRRSDVTYDVVSVWGGKFFRLDDHLRRFQASMEHFRLQPRDLGLVLVHIRPPSHLSLNVLQSEGLAIPQFK